MSDKQRIIHVSLDEHTVIRRSPQIEHERKVAIYDILEENQFEILGGIEGPYNLHISTEENRLIFDVRDEIGGPLTKFTLPISSFRSIVKDYFVVCDSYFQAIKTLTPSQIEAIDMGRRGLHNEGAELLRDRLADKVKIDENTSRRLFTLICVLHIKA
ncbi:MAG: UPF0262 family protein [Rhodospirillales bacterium]|nr:UPF0262 family protein [Rhodospirillales bacterium]